MNSVRALPPSQVPSFEAQFRRKDGTILPVTLHISALRNGGGAMEGLVVVALDRSATLRQEQAARESQERYRDLRSDERELQRLLAVGAEKARRASEPTLEAMYERMGFVKAEAGRLFGAARPRGL
jgi:PAS domain-containing protein